MACQCTDSSSFKVSCTHLVEGKGGGEGGREGWREGGRKRK